MFRLSSLLSLLIAGLRREDQRSIWFSDSDETLETFTRREQFGRLASYLSYGLTRWRRPADHEFSTTGSPDAPAWAEDAVAIPDLVAGACCNLSFLLPTFGGTELWTRTIRAGDTKDRRARQIGNWMAMASGRLRLILSRLALDENGAIRSSAQFFAGTLRSPDPYGPARR